MKLCGLVTAARAALLAPFVAGCAAFGGVQVEAVRASAQKPSNVAIFVAVTEHGEPVTDLEEKNFRIYENEQLLSPRQIQRVLLSRDPVTEERVLLLVDVSGSPTTEQREAYARATEAFVRKLQASVRVSVRAFDGGEGLKPVGDFARGSSDPNASALMKIQSADNSRNLNGAISAGLAELDRAVSSQNKPIKIGTLVVFSRGPDLAGRVDEGKLYESLSATEHDVIGIGVGLDTPYLDFADAGVIHSQDGDTLPIAFEEAGARVAKTHAKYYLVAYCSPARGGQRTVRVEVSYTATEGEEKIGDAYFDFDATGFSPGCNPAATPRFEKPVSVRAEGEGDGGKVGQTDEARVNKAPGDQSHVVPPPSSGDYAK